MTARRFASGLPALLWGTFAALAVSVQAVHGQEALRQGSGEESVEAGLEARTYTWRDGDRTLKAVLLTESEASEVLAGASAGRDPEEGGRQGIVAAVSAARAAGQPVFRSSSGRLMMLPGGVLLVVDPKWSEEETAALLAANGVSMSLVTPFDWLPNGYLIETEPGFASLELANALAEFEGVELSSPNWWREMAMPE